MDVDILVLLELNVQFSKMSRPSFVFDELFFTGYFPRFACIKALSSVAPNRTSGCHARYDEKIRLE